MGGNKEKPKWKGDRKGNGGRQRWEGRRTRTQNEKVDAKRRGGRKRRERERGGK